jgi:O-antigen/teichoic acid export membrane protein
MAESRRQLLSIGVFFIILVFAILLIATGALVWYSQAVPVALVLFGIWLVALGDMRKANPQKYERGGFSTMIMGGCLIALGAAWFVFFAFANGWLYAVAIILLALGLIAIAAATRKK